MTAGPRPRVGLVTPAFRLFDDQMPATFRTALERRAASMRDVLAQCSEVVHSGLVSDLADAEKAKRQLKAYDVDVIVIAPTMAAPPAYSAAAIVGIQAPILIWNTNDADTLPADLDQVSAHRDTTAIGALMVSNLLIRSGIRANVVSSSTTDPAGVQRLKRHILGLAGARRLRGSRFLRIGDPIAGYSNIVASNSDLSEIGVEEVAVAEEEFADRFDACTNDDVDRVRRSAASMGWKGSIDDRSARIAACMDDLVAETGAVGGTINCHSEMMRFSSRIGVAGCVGLSLCSAKGTPFSCTGDQPTAIALHIGKTITGSALYAEIYTYEGTTGLALLANGGEGDTTISREAPTLAPNDLYPGLHGTGTGVAFAVSPGPATVLSASPSDHGWRLIYATGTITARTFPRMLAPNAMFQFDGLQDDIASTWISAGAIHHHAVVKGDISSELEAVGRSLGMNVVNVCANAVGREPKP